MTIAMFPVQITVTGADKRRVARLLRRRRCMPAPWVMDGTHMRFMFDDSRKYCRVVVCRIGCDWGVTVDELRHESLPSFAAVRI